MTGEIKEKKELSGHRRRCREDDSVSSAREGKGEVVEEKQMRGEVGQALTTDMRMGVIIMAV